MPAAIAARIHREPNACEYKQEEVAHFVISWNHGVLHITSRITRGMDLIVDQLDDTLFSLRHHYERAASQADDG